MGATIEAVRGMRDVLPDEQRMLGQIQARLNGVLASYGYEPLDLPAVEYRDLYQRKLGEELVGKVYEFRMGGRDLALRPEWTASVLRAFVSTMQEQPLPLRLRYCGPVFRYERPQRHTYRQFIQVGVELIGAAVPRGDAEVMALACAGLEANGLHDYYVQIGHIGLVRQILTRLGLAERTQGLLIWSMERIRTRGLESVREQLNAVQGDLPIDPSLLAGLDDDQASELLLHVLETMQINLSFGTRPPEAIVNRLVRKMRREDPAPLIERALDIVGQLSEIRGDPNEALPRAAALLEAANLPTNALTELRAVLDLLEAHGVARERLVLDLGLARGLNYYTGVIFEAYNRDGAQLCGGGRYDDLVLALGGRKSVPAVGFTYGLERIAAALSTSAVDVPPRQDVQVVPVTDADYTYALEVARRLRASGFTVTVDVRGRGVTSNLRDASRRGVAYVAIVGDQERAEQTLVWRDLTAHDERRIGLDEIGRLRG
jgi:histidyl-tRNA synthetase